MLIFAVDVAPWWAPLVQTLLGALIGFAGSVAVPFVTQEAKRLSDQRAVAGLLAGELSSLLFIIKKRGYLEQLERMIKNGTVGYYFSFSGESLIYLQEMTRVGLLPPPVCEYVIQSYNLLFAALEDAKSLQHMKAEHDKRPDDPTKTIYYPSDWLQVYKGLSNFFSEFIEKAEIAVPGLKEIARQSAY